MASPGSLALPVCALILAPSLLGIINRTKAFVAGRRGPPVLQPYRDINEISALRAVYGDVTTWLFRLGPVVGLATLAAALPTTPFGGIGAPVSFSGDLFVLADLLGARPLFDRARGARYRLQLRRHGCLPRGAFRSARRTRPASRRWQPSPGSQAFSLTRFTKGSASAPGSMRFRRSRSSQ